MKTEIEKAIRKAINRHLVTHVQTPNDTRDRIDILVNEAATEILKLVVQPDVIKSVCDRCDGKPENECKILCYDCYVDLHGM